MRQRFLAIGLLVIFGAAKMPLEQRLQVEQAAAHFHKQSLDLGLRERIGQMSFLAALSGFRSLVAAILWIQAHTAWENTEWGRMAGLFDTVTTLQPRSLVYWDLSAWHMAYNASVAAMQDTKQPSEALRKRAQRQYFELGRDFLERGTRNNPDRYLLFERLGILLRDKFDDHCGAAAAYAKAAEFPDAPDYIRRFVAYELAQCPGHDREAYEKLLQLFNQGQKERLPTLLTRIRELEEKLAIPSEERIDNKTPGGVK